MRSTSPRAVPESAASSLIKDMRAQIQTLIDDALADDTPEELTDKDWDEIKRTKPEEVDVDSLAVPPGWRPTR